MSPLFEASIGGISKFYEIFLLSILGIISGLVGSVYMKGLTGPLKIPKQIPVFFLPIIAGGICGVVGIFLPELLGLGTDTIRSLIEAPTYIGYLVFSFDRETFFNSSLYKIRFIWRDFFSSFVYRSLHRKYFCIFIRVFC